MIGQAQRISTPDINEINQQIQDFQNGKINISKEELTNIVSDEIKQGQDPSNSVLDIIDSYDKIDTNNDGISYDEFKTYKNSPKGLLSFMGISSLSISQQINSLTLGMLGNNSANDSTGLSLLNQQPSILDSGIFDNNNSSDIFENSFESNFLNQDLYTGNIDFSEYQGSLLDSFK